MKRKTFWGFAGPSVVVMTVLMVFPLATTIYLSFFRVLPSNRYSLSACDDLGGSCYVGWKNYGDVFNDDEFWTALWFTLKFVAVTVPIQTVFGLAVALLLDRVRRGRAFYMAALLMPFIVTPVVGSLLVKDLFARTGLISKVTTWITSDPEATFQLTNGNVNWIIFLQSIWHVMPFAFISLFAGLQSLPEERMEAASIDGAGFWRALWHVKIPHLRAIFMFILMISLMDAYRVYDSVFIFATERFASSRSLQMYTIEVATDVGRVGRGNALSVLTVLGVFVILLPFLYISYKDQLAERT
ncbi:MAG: carbohydrate ABC transporter permease [Acidimicrobiales bacterium]